MAAGKRGLDRALAGAEPVERAIEFDLVDGAEFEQPAEARAGAARSRAVASLEAGETRRLAINAIAKGARRLSVGRPSSRSRPIARIVPSTAAA